MDKKAPMPGQTLRLASAYERMDAKGRESLDRLVGQLAEVHWVNAGCPEKDDCKGIRGKLGL
jgi:hypothetical protein